MSYNARRFRKKGYVSHERELARRFAKATCPYCRVRSVLWGKLKRKDANGCTLNCAGCGSLLIICHNRVQGFHEYINSVCSAWPADGKGTAYVEIKA